MLPLEDVAEYVLGKLAEVGVPLPVDTSTFEFDWHPACSGNNHYRCTDPGGDDADRGSSEQTT